MGVMVRSPLSLKGPLLFLLDNIDNTRIGTNLLEIESYIKNIHYQPASHRGNDVVKD